MENSLVQNIATCVEKDMLFDGRIGTTYSVQELFHAVGLKSLNTLYKATKKRLDELDTDSLFENSNTVLKNKLQLQVDTIKGVFAYKKDLVEKEKEKQATRDKRAALLALRSKKEVEAFEGMSLEELDKELAKTEV